MATSVSICIATYRGAKRLERLFHSFEEAGLQKDPYIQIVIADDGSPSGEDGAHAVQEMVFRSPFKMRTTLVGEPENRGYVATLRSAISEARGTVLLFLDDDVLLPQGLIEGLRYLMGVTTGVLSWRSQGSNPGQSQHSKTGFLEPATQLAGYCMAIRRSLYEELGGLDARFRTYCADSDLALRATLSGRVSYRVWWPLVPHEEHGAFKDSQDLDRHAIASRDLALFHEKWSATGEEMERRALQALREG